jgi:hypothetical protein
MTTTSVHFDRKLRRLDAEDAAAWSVWLTQHQLNGFDIACPSVLTYTEPTRRKSAAATVELLTRDARGVDRSRRTVYFSGPPVPFPPAIESPRPMRLRGRERGRVTR